jgi:hypothetical protein
MKPGEGHSGVDASLFERSSRWPIDKNKAGSTPSTVEFVACKHEVADGETCLSGQNSVARFVMC